MLWIKTIPDQLPTIMEKRDILFEAAASCPDRMAWGKDWLTRMWRRLEEVAPSGQRNLLQHLAEIDCAPNDRSR